MKKLLLSLLLLPSLISFSQVLNVMSFNIRLNVKSDSLNAWPFRKDLVASQVVFHDTHILGVQEALHEQMTDLGARLINFKYAGVARDDGKEKGEYSAIFYDTTRVQLIETKTFWLSETPEIPGSKSWDAAITRIVTWAKFKHRKSGNTFYVFNTHFDHMGKEARKQSARIILEKAKSIAGNFPVILMGDFNSMPADEPYKVLTDTSKSFYFTDTQVISKSPHYGPSGTFNGFTTKEIHDDPIDYIFIRKGIRVLKHATLSQTWKGRFSSDHFPVFAQLELNKSK